jgi:hypothetical protein
MAQFVEQLPSKCKALSSNPQTNKNVLIDGEIWFTVNMSTLISLHLKVI